MAKPKADMELMNITQVSEYLGGNFGINQITKLMKSGTLETISKDATGMLLTRKKYVDRFLDVLFARPLVNEYLSSYPLHEMLKKVKQAG